MFDRLKSAALAAALAVSMGAGFAAAPASAAPMAAAGAVPGQPITEANWPCGPGGHIRGAYCVPNRPRRVIRYRMCPGGFHFHRGYCVHNRPRWHRV
ncbi:MAG: hypothetical protein KGI57_06855, partial [Hyphomicrobiales bacterium]|nr:hypothetical protein [Hyphomicrobiales bacterium]